MVMYSTLAPGIKLATVGLSAGEHEHTNKTSPESFNKPCTILTGRATHKIKNLFTEPL